MTSIAEIRGSSPIFTDGAPVSTSAITMSYDIANHSDAQGAYYCEWTSFEDTWAGNHNMMNWGDSQANGIYKTGSLGNFRLATVGNTSNINGVNFIAEVAIKLAGVYSQSENKSTINAEGVYGDEPTFSEFRAISITLINKNQRPSLLRDVRRFNLPYQEARDKIDELMTTVTYLGTTVEYLGESVTYSS